MKIFKFNEYINENLSDTPESYVSAILTKLKSKIDKMFLSETPEENVGKESSFKDIGLELQSSEISKYSKVYDNLKVKYSDDEYLYDITFTIDLKDAVNADETKDFNIDDIEDCSVKFKKYNLEGFELIGFLTKTVKIKDINEDMLSQLKIELDEMYGDEEDEFEIET